MAIAIIIRRMRNSLPKVTARPLMRLRAHWQVPQLTGTCQLITFAILARRNRGGAKE
jgi:hypothetical protein